MRKFYGCSKKGQLCPHGRADFSFRVKNVKNDKENGLKIIDVLHRMCYYITTCAEEYFVRFREACLWRSRNMFY